MMYTTPPTHVDKYIYPHEVPHCNVTMDLHYYFSNGEEHGSFAWKHLHIINATLRHNL